MSRRPKSGSADSSRVFIPGGRAGEISILLSAGEEGARSMTVRDNGVGLPAERDISQSGSLGMKIISLLVKQINGSLEMASDGGAVFRVSFKGDGKP